MNRSHVLIIVVVLALAVGAVIFFSPGKAAAAGGGAPATDPALGSGYAGDSAGPEYYGETPALPPKPSPVKSFLSSSLGKNVALGAVALPLVSTKLAIQGGKTLVKAGLSGLKSLF